MKIIADDWLSPGLCGSGGVCKCLHVCRSVGLLPVLTLQAQWEICFPLSTYSRPVRVSSSKDSLWGQVKPVFFRLYTIPNTEENSEHLPPAVKITTGLLSRSIAGLLTEGVLCCSTSMWLILLQLPVVNTYVFAVYAENLCTAAATELSRIRSRTRTKWHLMVTRRCLAGPAMQTPSHRQIHWTHLMINQPADPQEGILLLSVQEKHDYPEKKHMQWTVMFHFEIYFRKSFCCSCYFRGAALGVCCLSAFVSQQFIRAQPTCTILDVFGIKSCLLLILNHSR